MRLGMPRGKVAADHLKAYALVAAGIPCAFSSQGVCLRAKLPRHIQDLHNVSLCPGRCAPHPNHILLGIFGFYTVDLLIQL